MSKKESYPLRLLAIFILLWIALSINVNYREDWKEFKESLRIKSYKPLGEEKLREWQSSLRKGIKN